MSRIYLTESQKQHLRHVISETDHRISRSTLRLTQTNTHYLPILTDYTILPVDVINIIYSYSHTIIHLDIEYNIFESESEQIMSNLRVKNDIFDFVFHNNVSAIDNTCNIYVNNIKNDIFYTYGYGNMEQSMDMEDDMIEKGMNQDEIVDVFESESRYGEDRDPLDIEEIIEKSNIDYRKYIKSLKSTKQPKMMYEFTYSLGEFSNRCDEYNDNKLNYIIMNDFFNLYMSQYYDLDNYLHMNTTPVCKYRKNNIFYYKISTYDYNYDSDSDNDTNSDNDNLIILLRPQNHKKLKHIIVICKIIQKALLSIFNEMIS